MRTCQPQFLELAGTGRIFSRFTYQTEHSFEEVTAPNYFLPAASAYNGLRPLDRIEGYADINRSPTAFSFVVTKVNRLGGEVVVQDFAAMPETVVNGRTGHLVQVAHVEMPSPEAIRRGPGRPRKDAA